MVSETPRSDRCGARVVTKEGLEILFEASDSDALTDADLACVRMIAPSGADIIESYPDYQDVQEYRWNDYDTTAVAVTTDPAELDLPEGAEEIDRPDVDAPIGADPSSLSVDITQSVVTEFDLDDAVGWICLDEVATDVTNERSTLDGYCERHPMDNGRCYVHGGNADTPEGNANAMTHGMRAKRSTYWNSLEPNEKADIEAWVDDFLDDAEFTRDHRGKTNELYRVCIDMHRASNGLDEYVDDDGDHAGLTKMMVVDTDENGEEVYAEAEHPANLPYSRLDNDIIGKLEKLGVMSSPDQKKAEAQTSIAQKLSGMNDDS